MGWVFLEEGLGGLLGVVRGDGLASQLLEWVGLVWQAYWAVARWFLLGPCAALCTLFLLGDCVDSNSATKLTNNFLDKGIKLQPLHIAYQYVCCFYVLYIFNPYMV
jgi:hypothetical protein